MTLIEFFDTELLENIIGTLVVRPERVVLFGKNREKMESFVERVAPLISAQNISTDFLVVTVNTNNFYAVKEMLTKLCETYSDCLFDLLGGEETVLVAMGAVANEKNIPLCSIRPMSGKLKKFYPNGNEEKQNIFPALSVSDIVTIFGGTVVENTPCTKEKEMVIDSLWNICKAHCGRWNTAIEKFSDFIPSPVEHPDFDGVTVSVPNRYFTQDVMERSARTRNMVSVLADIKRAGLCKEHITDTAHIFTFCDADTLSILEKSGTLLELYTLLSVQKAKTEWNTPLVNNALSGVVINWEYPPDGTEDDDVKNEIDVFATKGAIPVFISCKNGGVDSDELYKLNTVAQRFGGKYAKKILVMTYFDVPESFMKRAQAMNIRIIRNVQELEEKTFIEKLQGAMQ